MKSVEYLTIGELASTCSVSVDRVRNYDKIGLLEPVYRDKDSGRRYYSVKHIFYLSIIDELRNLDFSLKDIKKIFCENDIEKIIEIYSKNMDMIDKKLKELSEIKKSIKKRLTNFEDITTFSKNKKLAKVTIKELDKRHFIAMKFNLKVDLNAFISAHQKLIRYVHENNLRAYSPISVAFYGQYEECTAKKTELELCKPTDKEFENDSHFKTFEKGTYATILFKGSLLSSLKEHSILTNWIKDNGYKTKGPLIKKYITDTFNSKDPDEFFGEFQIMIYK